VDRRELDAVENQGERWPVGPWICAARADDVAVMSAGVRCLPSFNELAFSGVLKALDRCTEPPESALIS